MSNKLKNNKNTSASKKTPVTKKNTGLTNTTKKTTTLSDEITQLVTEDRPKSFDPESAEFGDVSLYRPSIEDFGDITDDNSQGVRIKGEIPSAFTTGKYAGKKSSRKESNLEEESEDEEDMLDQFDNQDDSDIEDNFEFEDRVLTSNTIDEADNLMKQLEQDDEEEDGDDQKQPKLVSRNTATEALDELEKAKNTKNQTDLFDEFLTSRIHLQKSIGIANRLPKPADHKLMIQNDKTIKDQFESAANEAKSLLSDLFQLQSELISRNSEITQHKQQQQSKKRFREAESSLSSMWSVIEEQNTRLFTYAASSIEKWNSRVNISAAGIGGGGNKQLKSINQSIMAQVNNTLNDIERLHKRTRLKRSQYTIIGQQPQKQTDNKTTTKLEEYDDEVFDDTDFYQVLLKEIEKTSAGSEQEVGSQYWKEMQALKKKTKKRPTNNKASKGRQLRYETFTKLENFMPPVPAPLPPWNLDQLYSSLFGGIGVGNE